jgi:hypothetical protein
MDAYETEVVVGDERMRDRKGRKQLTEARWEALMSEYEGSGLTQAEFARRSGLIYTTFAHRVQQRRREARSGAVAPRFVEVRPALPTEAPAEAPMTATPSGLSVTLPDGVVLRGADPAALAALVRALRAK